MKFINKQYIFIHEGVNITYRCLQFVPKIMCRLLDQLTCTKYNYYLNTVKKQRKSKFFVSGTPYIGIVATINFSSKTFASC